MNNYAWASITDGSRNIGNQFIEASLMKLLDLPAPSISFNSFAEQSDSLVEEINETCSFVINPGCTTLQPTANPGFKKFDQIKIPKPCFGGCVWPAGKLSKLEILARMLSTKRGPIPPVTGDITEIAQKMSSPVGVRDPYTRDLLESEGVEVRFVGCPTLLNPVPTESWKKLNGNNLIFSLGRFAIPAQLQLLRKLSRRWQVTALVHEHYESSILKLIPNINVVTFIDSEQFFGNYRDADVVLTGRLHGALPAIRYGTPVVVFGETQDTRNSLLSYLGQPLRQLNDELAELESLTEIRSPSLLPFERIATLREAFGLYCNEFGIKTTF